MDRRRSLRYQTSVGKQVIRAIIVSLSRVAVFTILLLLLIEGFLTEALSVSIKEGQADIAIETARKLVEQFNILIKTLLATVL